jgi:phospho-N-acetylmuramoyl-pentapeptide-transferase
MFSSISAHVIAFIVVFAASLILGPVFIPILSRLKFGQTVRDDGPASHLKKTGTPTIGGIIFLLPVILVSFYFSGDYPELIPLATGCSGFRALLRNSSTALQSTSLLISS